MTFSKVGVVTISMLFIHFIILTSQICILAPISVWAWVLLCYQWLPYLCLAKLWYDIYLLTAIGLSPGGSNTVHFYTQTIHRTTQLTQTIHRTTQLTNWEECEPCPIFVSYTLAFASQLRKKHGKTLVRVAKEWQLARWKWNIQNRAYITIIHKHNHKNT